MNPKIHTKNNLSVGATIRKGFVDKPSADEAFLFMEKEIWKPTHISPHYLVSSLGNVKSVTRFIPFRGILRKHIGRNIAPVDNGRGYKCVSIHFDNSCDRIYIHRLVAIVFIPNPENKPHINHKNGIKSDNRVENLEWVTIKENAEHASKNGLLKPACQQGILNPRNKLSEKDIILIRSLRGKFSAVELAKRYGVVKYHIYGIWNGHNWKHLS